jgi:hypothetical protein
MGIITLVSLLLCLAGAATSANTTPSGNDILKRVAAMFNERRAAMPEYTGVRHYTLRNLRFGLQATTTVRMTYTTTAGKRFTVLARSGSDRLNAIIDRLLESESRASRPEEDARHAITPANYAAGTVGLDTLGGRRCYVLELKPRAKNKFLIKGRAWVDAATYGVVRLEGRPAAGLSWWVGEPRISEDFAEVGGFWFPAHMRSECSSLMLGTSHLEIAYTEYQVSARGEPSALAARELP